MIRGPSPRSEAPWVLASALGEPKKGAGVPALQARGPGEAPCSMTVALELRRQRRSARSGTATPEMVRIRDPRPLDTDAATAIDGAAGPATGGG
jgi:hypothetical protein